MEPEIAIDPIEELELQRAELAGQLNEINGKLHALTAARREVSDALDTLTLKLEKLRPPTTHMSNLKAYVASQQEQRRERVERAERALGVGITAEILSGKSPLDQSMSRKVRRGVARPQQQPVGT